jgi:hypothetical protein
MTISLKSLEKSTSPGIVISGNRCGLEWVSFYSVIYRGINSQTKT